MTTSPYHAHVDMFAEPGEDEPDWFNGLCLSKPTSLTRAEASPLTGEIVAWRWWVPGARPLELIARHAFAESRALGPVRVSVMNGSLRQVEALLPRPVPAVHMWAVCVLVGLLPERSLG